MNINNFLSLLVFTIVISLNCYVFGLDIGKVKEETCIQPEAITNLNYTWAGSIDFWYSPLWNKVELYQTIKSMLTQQEFENLKEEDAIKSCIYFNLKSTAVPIYGFGNKFHQFESHLSPIRQGVADWTDRADQNGNKNWLGNRFLVMTDNKSAIMSITFRKDGTKGFSISSVDKKVSEEFLTKAKAYLIEKVGFNSEHFVETNYDDCPAPPPLDELKWKA